MYKSSEKLQINDPLTISGMTLALFCFFCLFCLLFVDFTSSSNDFKTNFAKMRLMLSLTVAHAQTLKGTATLMITMFFMKDHNKP